MTGLRVLAVLAALLGTTGLLLIAHQAWPAPPRLEDALARIAPTSLSPDQPARPERGTARVGAWLVARVARPAGLLALPRTDLALLGQPAAQFMGAKLAYAVVGLAAPGAGWTLLALAGAAPPWTLPMVAGAGVGAGLWFLPDYQVRQAARARRRQFRYAFTAYLQLVIMERDAGAALNTALEAPAQITSGWAFARIHGVLARARRAQTQPWHALAELGKQIGVPDLVDLAHTAQIAGGEGARMHDVLAAKIAAMRHEAAADARAEANARTTTMWVPTSLLMLGFVVLVGFPFFARLLTAG